MKDKQSIKEHDEVPAESEAEFEADLAEHEVLGFENGWVRIDMRNTPVDNVPPGGDGIFDGIEPRFSLGNLGGLPVTGFWVERFVNNNVGNGIKANYGGIFGHKGTRLFTNCDGTGCTSPR